ncbi:MAG TPA: hypothetical protein VKY29_05125, partial [Cryomorphaceae bacterium]|nr:hypothetical protein [Cryomorphaceae bacterium]
MTRLFNWIRKTCRAGAFMVVAVICSTAAFGAKILIPMDESQSNHLKAYGIAYWVLENDIEVQWLL